MEFQSLESLVISVKSFSTNNVWKKQLRGIFSKKLRFSSQECDLLIKLIHKCCLISYKDGHIRHKMRVQGLKYINVLIEKGSIECINTSKIIYLYWSILSCMHHHLLRLRLNMNVFISISRRREYNNVIKVYRKLVDFVKFDSNLVFLFAILQFFKAANLWVMEKFCIDAIYEHLRIACNIENGLTEILKFCDHISAHQNQSNEILWIVIAILKRLKWNGASRKFILQILKLLENSVKNIHKNNNLVCSIRMCIICMMQSFSNTNLQLFIELVLSWITENNVDDPILSEFATLAEHAATLYKIKNLEDALPRKICKHLYDLMCSTTESYTLLGNRVFQNLICKSEVNKIGFSSPRLFSRNSKFNIKINNCANSDKLFFRQYRDKFHDQLFYSIFNHPNNVKLLLSVYSTLALIVTELPCGYTAASGVCLAMAVQEYTLKNDNGISMEHKHRLHAFVSSILSLVCYIHSATDFYAYIEQIANNRNHSAPHLNPPVRFEYNYADHHVLWNKDELFFNDWEARYGLWKCFRTNAYSFKPNDY